MAKRADQIKMPAFIKGVVEAKGSLDKAVEILGLDADSIQTRASGYRSRGIPVPYFTRKDRGSDLEKNANELLESLGIDVTAGQKDLDTKAKARAKVKAGK